jgi:hypothetical protein
MRKTTWKNLDIKTCIDYYGNIPLTATIITISDLKNSLKQMDASLFSEMP